MSEEQQVDQAQVQPSEAHSDEHLSHITADDSAIADALDAISGTGASEQVEAAVAAMGLDPQASEIVANDELTAPVEAEPAKNEPAAEAKPEETAPGTAEDAPQETQDTDADPDKAGGKWEAVKAAEKRTLAAREESKRLKAEYQDMLAAAKKELEEAKALKDSYGEDPLAAIRKHNGMEFADLAKRVLNDNKASPEEVARRSALTAEERLAAMEQKIEQRFEERERKINEAQALNQYRGSVNALIESPSHSLLSALPSAAEEVVDVAEAWLAEHGEVLTPERATDMVLAEFKERLSGLKGHKAASEFLGLAAPTPQTEETTEKPSSPAAPSARPQQASKGPTSLTNKRTASPVAADMRDDGFDDLSEDEQIARVAQAIGPEAFITDG